VHIQNPPAHLLFRHARDAAPPFCFFLRADEHTRENIIGVEPNRGFRLRKPDLCCHSFECESHNFLEDRPVSRNSVLCVRNVTKPLFCASHARSARSHPRPQADVHPGSSDTRQHRSEKSLELFRGDAHVFAPILIHHCAVNAERYRSNTPGRSNDPLNERTVLSSHHSIQRHMLNHALTEMNHHLGSFPSHRELRVSECAKKRGKSQVFPLFWAM